MNFYHESFLSPHKLGFSYTTFSEFLQGLNIRRADLACVCGLSERTLRRHCNEDTAGPWLYVVAYCLAGRFLMDGWQGWRLHNGGIVHYSAYSTRHEPLMPQQLQDISWIHQHARHQARTLADLTRENNQLRAKLAGVDHRRLVPGNVIPFNASVTFEQIANQLKQQGA